MSITIIKLTLCTIFNLKEQWVNSEMTTDCMVACFGSVEIITKKYSSLSSIQVININVPFRKDDKIVEFVFLLPGPAALVAIMVNSYVLQVSMLSLLSMKVYSVSGMTEHVSQGISASWDCNCALFAISSEYQISGEVSVMSRENGATQDSCMESLDGLARRSLTAPRIPMVVIVLSIE